ncbi:MAG: hypothetical protein ACPHEP_02970 [Acidimicrobiales bacterium]
MPSLNGLGDRALGILEALGTVASSAVAEIPRGYGMLGGLLTTGDLDEAIAYGNRVGDNLVYGPTERSLPYLEALGEAIDSAMRQEGVLTGLSGRDVYDAIQGQIISMEPEAAGRTGAAFESVLAGAIPGNRAWRTAANLPEVTMRNLEKSVERVPEVEGILPYLSDAELQRVTPLTSGSLVATYNAINPEDLVGASVGGAPKLGWYEQTAEAIETIMGDDTPRFAGLLAALSPQTSVEMNLLNTVNTWSNWEKAGRPQGREEILDILNDSVLGEEGKDSVLDAWKNNSVRALTSDPDPETGLIMLSGPKVNDFSQAVQGDLSRFVNDAWQANLTGVPQSMFSGSGDVLPGYGPGYLGASARGRQVAEEMSLRLGEDILPSEVQETGWSFAKALYEQMTAERAAGNMVTATEIIENNLLDAGRIADVPDFASLFTMDQYGAPLREIGYGSLIDRAARASQGIGGRDISAAGGQEGALDVARRLDNLFRHRQFVSATVPIRPRFSPSGATSGGRQVDGPYRVSGSQSVPLGFGASGKAQSPTPELSSAAGVEMPVLYQLNKSPKDISAFVRVMKEAQESRGALGRSVDIYDPKEYKGYKLFTTKDGSAGFAISPSGELSSAVSNMQSGIKGFADSVIAAGVANGARWLNAFDTVLPQKYSRFGFKPVARIKFDEGFARSEWGDAAVDEFMAATKGYQNGNPDLVFMVYDPTFTGVVGNNVGGRMVDSWDKAMARVDKELERLSKKR